MPPSPSSPLQRLREIRDAQKRARDLIAERDHLIRQAAADELPFRQIAIAAGLTPGRVHQIASNR